MRTRAAGTIVAKSCLPHARVLANSFQRFHPEIPFFVLLADDVGGCFDPEREPYRILSLADLHIPGLDRLVFGYTMQEFSYSLTPYLLAHLLDRGFDAVLFLKQESLVLDALRPEFALLDAHSILLTPHLLTPLSSASRELSVLQAGVYNGGFIGVSGSPEARRFLDWWKDRLRDTCVHAVADGMHFEQRWLDFVPAYFEDIHVLRDPGINVGHWNLPERRVCVHDDAVIVDNVACRFFRFSGFEPERPQFATCYSPRLTMENAGPAALVFERYRGLLEEAGYYDAKSWPYAFGSFDNGVPIPRVAREIYRALGAEVARFGNPTETAGSGSFFRWLNEPAPVTRLLRGIYGRRPDVQRAYPDIDGRDKEAFLAWASTDAVSA